MMNTRPDKIGAMHPIFEEKSQNPRGVEYLNYVLAAMKTHPALDNPMLISDYLKTPLCAM